MTSTGDQFQRQTKYDRSSMPRTALDRSSQPKLYKEYPDVKRVDLPPAKPLNDCPLHNAIRNRKSIRDFADVPLISAHSPFCLHPLRRRTAPRD